MQWVRKYFSFRRLFWLILENFFPASGNTNKEHSSSWTQWFQVKSQTTFSWEPPSGFLYYKWTISPRSYKLRESKRSQKKITSPHLQQLHLETFGQITARMELCVYRVWWGSVSLFEGVQVHLRLHDACCQFHIYLYVWQQSWGVFCYVIWEDLWHKTETDLQQPYVDTVGLTQTAVIMKLLQIKQEIDDPPMW